MAVALDEPGNDEGAVEIDHLRVGPDVRPDLPVRSNGEDRVALHGDCLAIGNVFVDGHDLAAPQDQIGLDLRSCGAAGCRCGKD